jgi:hypothetical protein
MKNMDGQLLCVGVRQRAAIIYENVQDNNNVKI